MAVNENTLLPNRHQLYLATSGFGKSQVLKRKGSIPKSGSRIVLWDTNRDHEFTDTGKRNAYLFTSLSECLRAMERGHNSGKGFRIGYAGDASPDAFEVFSHGVWEILDGNKLTYIIVEEYSDCCRNAGPLSQRLDHYHRKLWTQGRKYGAIIHATSQRPQMISKDSLGQAGNFYASAMDVDGVTRVAKEMNIKWTELQACTPGEFYFREKAKSLHSTKSRIFTPIQQ